MRRTFFKFGMGKHADSPPNKAAGFISKLPSGLLHVLLNSQSRLGDQVGLVQLWCNLQIAWQHVMVDMMAFIMTSWFNAIDCSWLAHLVALSYLRHQDITIMNGQETSMRKSHLTRHNYNLFARADEGIKALHEFFKQAA